LVQISSTSFRRRASGGEVEGKVPKRLIASGRGPASEGASGKSESLDSDRSAPTSDSAAVKVVSGYVDATLSTTESTIEPPRKAQKTQIS